MDKEKFRQLVKDFKPDTLIHMGAMLSAAGEKNPDLCFDVNVTGFRNALDIAKENNLRIFSPSTIAVYGSETPKINVDGKAFARPSTMYGVTKILNEKLGYYYR